MGAGPIEDQATEAVKNGTGPIAAMMEGTLPPPQSGAEYFGTETVTPPNASRVAAGMPEHAAPTGPVETLITEMHLFIEAQTDMIHNSDVPRFATAQERYILAQNNYIRAMLGTK